MEVNAVQQQLIDLFAEQLQIDVPAIDTDLVDEGLLDSLIFVDLIMHLEQTFGVEIPVEDLEIDQFRSIAKISEVVGGKSETPAEVA